MRDAERDCEICIFSDCLLLKKINKMKKNNEVSHGAPPSQLNPLNAVYILKYKPSYASTVPQITGYNRDRINT